jgi:negative regulator of flagellin synthesis FlgM
MPIEIGPQRIDPARALGAVSGRFAQTSSGSRPSATGEPVVERSEALDPGPVPVDHDRVAEIRKAIERGDYPILPAKVADAMIAAGLLLRSGK